MSFNRNRQLNNELLCSNTLAEKVNLCKEVLKEAKSTLLPQTQKLKLLMEEREKIIAERNSAASSLQDDLKLLEDDYQDALSKLDEEERIELCKLEQTPSVNYHSKEASRRSPVTTSHNIKDVLKVVKRHGRSSVKKEVKEKVETAEALKDFWMVKASAVECLMNVVNICKELDEKEIKEAKDLQAKYMATQISFTFK